MGYNPNFLPTTVSDVLGNVGGYTFDERGSILSRLDGNGQPTTFSYDQYGNKVSETNALGQANLFGYDTLGRMTVMTDAVGNLTRYGYDALGRMTVMTATLSGVNYVTSYSYDNNGNQTQVVQPGNRTTGYEYDQANRLTKITLPNPTTGALDPSRTLQYTYDWRGNKLTETDQLGRITKYEYDLVGQLIATTSAFGTSDQAKMVTTYDAAGRKTADTNPNLHTTLYEYDIADRLITIKAPYSTGTISATTILDYDAANRKTKETDPNGRQTRFDYDYRGRLITTTFPTLADGTVLSTTQSYDGAGNLQQKKDQAGKQTSYGYDSANRLTSVTNALSQITSYRYDPVGRLLEIKDAKNQRTQFQYDLWGRQTQKTWPDGSYEQYGYDEVSNRTVVTTTQLAGQSAQANTFTYNKLNQLTQASYFDGRTVSYVYTLSGQRQSATDSLWGTTSYTYDQRERITTIASPNIGGSGRSVGYKYDGLGNRTVMTATANTTNLITNYTYDNAERLRTVSNSTHFAGTATYDYDKVGMRSQLALPNGVNVTYSYDELNRLTNLTQTNSGGNLASYTYQLGLAGNRTKVTELGGNSVEWGYDATYRLTSEVRKATGGVVLTTTNFTYDAVGNRQKQAITVGSTISITNYSYNELDQLKTVLGGGVSTSYSYDRRGNLLQAGSSSYGFDAADRMISATVQAASASYLYDHDNRRVKQIAGGNTVYYLWDELSAYGDIALETDGSNAVQASYALGNGELLSQKKSSTVSYFLMDGHSGVRGLTNSSGNISENYNYDAFGSLLGGPTNPATNYLYTGQQFDSLTQLYSLRARYYNPAYGRFLMRDSFPILINAPKELNEYLYVSNSPVNLVDPSGQAETAIGTAGGGLGEYSTLLQFIKKYEKELITIIGLTAACITAINVTTVINAVGGDSDVVPAPEACKAKKGPRCKVEIRARFITLQDYVRLPIPIGAVHTYIVFIDQNGVEDNFNAGPVNGKLKTRINERSYLFKHKCEEGVGTCVKHDKLVKYSEAVDSANIKYEYLGPNSNSFTNSALKYSGINSNKPLWWIAPGWDTSLGVNP